MTQNIRSKVKQFLTSEVGQVTVRGPLVLGVASGALLLSQAGHTPSAEAHFQCYSDSDCGSGKKCEWRCNGWSNGTCIEWGSQCVSSDS